MRNTLKAATLESKFPLLAVEAGGGLVHRTGLSESILIFDQHRVFSTDFAERLQTLRRLDPERKVAVEVGNVEEGVRAAELGADILQCDKMTPQDVAVLVTAAKRAHPVLVISAAGGVNAANAADYARAGADFLVTSWPYFGRPHDVKMRMSASCDALP